MKQKERTNAEHPEPDFGTPELAKRRHIKIEQADPNDITTRRIRVEQDQIDWLARRDYTTREESDALRKWQTIGYLAGLDPPVTQSLEPVISGRAELSDIRLAAQKQRVLAIKALNNAAYVSLVDAVALSGISPGRYMMSRTGASPNEAMTMLRAAATILAKHFGLLR